MCNVSDVTELKDEGVKNAVVVQTTFPCEMSPHVMYSGTLYLYSDSFNENYLGEIPDLSLSK